MTVIRTSLILALLSLTACASAPRYVAADHASDYGYYSHQISEGRHRVGYNGGYRLGLESARDYAVMRAAELTLAEGYDWFRVVDRESHSVERPRTEAGFAYEHGYTRTRHCGLLGCTETMQPSARRHVSVRDSSRSSKHSYAIEVVMGTGALPAEGNCYDAREILKHQYNDTAPAADTEA